MQLYQLLLAQLRSTSRFLVFIFITSFLFIGFTLFLSLWQDVSIGFLTRDPATTTDTPVYLGFLSHIGSIFWSAAAAICFLSATVFHRVGTYKQRTMFFQYSGLLSLILLIDDLFQFHETILPDHIGIPEILVYVGYVLMIVVYLFAFQRTILQTHFLLLVIAFGFFGVSIVFDIILPDGETIVVLEDAAKFAGIVSWCAYFADVSIATLHSIIATPINE